jgi:hypothetical protein
MIGHYDNFPKNFHRVESFSTNYANRTLQQRLTQVLHEINRKKFSFEEIAYPTVPQCSIIFEIGLADSKNFNFIDDEETKKVSIALSKTPFRRMDFFWAVRYYKRVQGNKAPLRFDYYLMRISFGNKNMETKVFHERGPRYLSPEDLTTFLVNEINKTSTRKILKKAEIEPET